MANTRANSQQKQETEKRIEKLKKILQKEEIDIVKLEDKIKRHRETIAATERQLYQLIPKPKSPKKTKSKKKNKSTQAQVNDLAAVAVPTQPSIDLTKDDQSTQVEASDLEDTAPPLKDTASQPLDTFGASIIGQLRQDELK